MTKDKKTNFDDQVLARIIERMSSALEKKWANGNNEPTADAVEELNRAKRRDQLRPVLQQVPMHCRGPRAELVRRMDPKLFEAVNAWKWGDSSLLLVGATSLGKTSAAALLVRRLCAEAVYAGGEAFELARLIRWQSCRELTDVVRETKFGTGTPEAILRCQNARLLVLDDLGLSDDRGALERVLDTRYQRGWPTVTTTGATPVELRKEFTESLCRRLIEAAGKRGHVVRAGMPGPSGPSRAGTPAHP